MIYKQQFSFSDLGLYLRDCWMKLSSNLSLKFALLWLATCVDIFALRAQAMGATEMINAPGPWDELYRFQVWAIGPLDRHLLWVLALFFVMDIVLGITIAVAKGVFNHRRIFFSLVKGCVYIILLSVAWQFKQPGIVEIPFVGTLIALALEVFILSTEAISVIKNADLLLRIIGTDLPVLRVLIKYMERNLEDKSNSLFGSSSYKVLLVDDNSKIRKIVTDFLDNLGIFDVQVHGTLSTAMETVHRKTPDIVILDLHLPDSSGTGTFTTFSEKFPGIPVVVLTGTSDETTISEVKLSGAKWVLRKKGLKQQELVSTIIMAIETETKVLAIQARIDQLQLNKTLLPDEITGSRLGD